MHPDHGDDVHRRIRRLAESLGRQLEARGLGVVTVESCTGGWIAKAITDVPGSSGWFSGGWVTYSNACKQDLVGVSPETLERFGAVSAETVREMAAGGLARRPEAQLCVAVSGVAGPGGGTVDKPVGLVWFGWADRRGDGAAAQTDVMRFAGDRNAVRAASVLHALEGIAARL